VARGDYHAGTGRSGFGHQFGDGRKCGAWVGDQVFRV
jgi:hypothetical protein